MNRNFRWVFVGLLAPMLLVCGCGGGGEVSPPPPVINVQVLPSTANVRAGSTQAFTVTVTGTTNTSVTWKVNNVTGGNSTVGTIDGSGNYSAPAVLPNP